MFKLTTEEFNKLTEPEQKFYEEHDGGYRMKQDDTLKNALERTRAELAAVKDQVSQQPSAAQIKAWQDRDASDQKQKMDNESDLEKLRTMHDEQVAKMQAQLDESNKRLATQQLNQAALQAMNDAGITERGRRLLEHQIRQQLKLENDRVVVNAQDGSPTFDSPKKLAQSFKKDFPELFESQRNGGSGQQNPPNGAAGKSYTWEQIQTLPAKEQSEIFMQHGKGEVDIIDAPQA